MTKNAAPSRNPANDDSLAGTLQGVLAKSLQRVDDMLPCKVISYNRSTNRVRVQPLIALVTTTGEAVQRAPIAALPVLQLGGGGFVLSFPLVAGDLGWIKASDRDISLFLQAYREAKPNTARLHSFEDALFVPDVMTGYTIPGEDAAHAVLQAKGGAVRVAIWPDRIKLTAGAHVVTIGPSGVTIDSTTTTINGALTVTGAATLASTTATALTVAGLAFSSHKHTGVSTGGGTSGGPTA